MTYAAANATTFIYALVDPRDGRVRYVGKSNSPNSRVVRHHSPDHNSNTGKTLWISELSSFSLRARVIVLEEVPISTWQTAERRWIEKMRSEHPDLLNLCSGGNGSSTHSEETLKKLRGRKRSIETRAKMSRANVLRYSSPEARDKIASRLRGRVFSAETRAKMSAAMTGRVKKPETIAKFAAKMRGRSPTTETRDKIRAAHLGRKFSPETIKRMSAARRKVVHDKAARAKADAHPSFPLLDWRRG